MTSKEFHGIITALATPFDEKGEIDLQSFDKLLRSQLEARVWGVIVNGTTGESPTLLRSEQEQLLGRAVKFFKDTETRVYFGSGTNSTRLSIELSKMAQESGAQGLLVVTPYYNKPTQAGLIAHFEAIANSTQLPVLLYNVPGRTAVSMDIETVAALAKHPQIQGIKEASGDVERVSLIRERTRQDDFSVISGDDPIFFPSLLAGADGIVSVASNRIPELMVKMHENFKSKNEKKTAAMHESLYPFFRNLFLEPNPVPLKYALRKSGIFQTPKVRLPLVEMSEKNLNVWDSVLQALSEYEKSEK